MKLDDTLEALAPHVEARWRESGQSAEEAFGPAGDYARALDLPHEARWSPAQVLATWPKILLPVLGVWAIFVGASPDPGGERSQVSAGLVLSAGVFIASMVVVARFARKVLRLAVDHRAWFTLGFVVVVTVIALIGVPFGDVALASVPAGPTLAVGIAAVAASIVWNVLAVRAGAKRDDPLAPPRLRLDTGDRR